MPSIPSIPCPGPSDNKLCIVPTVVSCSSPCSDEEIRSAALAQEWQISRSLACLGATLRAKGWPTRGGPRVRGGTSGVTALNPTMEARNVSLSLSFSLSPPSGKIVLKRFHKIMTTNQTAIQPLADSRNAIPKNNQ